MKKSSLYGISPQDIQGFFQVKTGLQILLPGRFFRVFSIIFVVLTYYMVA